MRGAFREHRLTSQPLQLWTEWFLFTYVAGGASLAIIPQSVVRNPEAMARALSAIGASVAFLTPSHVDAILPVLSAAATPSRGMPALCGQLCGSDSAKVHKSPLPELRHVVCCGEALSISTVRRFYEVFAKSQLHNLYGPTEGSMTWFPCERGCDEVHIGKPIGNTVVVSTFGPGLRSAHTCFLIVICFLAILHPPILQTTSPTPPRARSLLLTSS